MLSAENIAKSYPTPGGELEILRGATLRLQRGQSAAIMGPSGCGKSTLLNILGTLEPPTSGSLTLDGANPFDLAPQALARFRNRRIGFVFQDHHLLPHLSVLENVLLPTLADGSGDADEKRADEEHAGGKRQGSMDAGSKGADARSRAKALLDRVGLSARLTHRPAELSGGERQRTAIARALIQQPALVLADEPTGNLDRASAADAANLLAELPRFAGVALIVVTHSESLASRFDSVFELNEGRLVELTRTTS
ncbi:MAG: ABC transporter ATP-binding protein [Phycisphaerales bacterium]|nr:ABC transporter ATP-binding protein [Phycisphaerales bacterium]